MKTTFQFQSLPKIENSDFIVYKKKKKLLSTKNYIKTSTQKLNDTRRYEKSFDFNSNSGAPELFLFNNLLSPIEKENKSNKSMLDMASTNFTNSKTFNTNKLKDSFVDMSSYTKKPIFEKRQPVEFDNYSLKNLKYEGPLSSIFTNSEFFMISNLINEILNNTYNTSKHTTFRTGYNKYRMTKVSQNSFDNYNFYVEEFNKKNEDLNLKELSNFLVNKFSCFGKKKDFVKSEFKEVKRNNLENILENIVRKIEVRKENNELISQENIGNLIKEEIDKENNEINLENITNILDKKNTNEKSFFKKINKTHRTIQNNISIQSEESFFPQIVKDTKSKNTTKNITEKDQKIPFGNYKMIANVKKITKNKKNEKRKNESPKKTFKFIKDQYGNYVAVEAASEDSKTSKIFNSNEKKEIKENISSNKYRKISNLIDLKDIINKNDNFVNDFIDDSENEKEKNLKRKINKNKRTSKDEEFLRKSGNNIHDKNYVNFFGEDVLESRKSFYLNFQKTHLNFPKKVDNFLITRSTGFGDDLGLGNTIGNMGAKFKNDIKEFIEKNKEKDFNNEEINIKEDKEINEDNNKYQENINNIVINNITIKNTEITNNNNININSLNTLSSKGIIMSKNNLHLNKDIRLKVNETNLLKNENAKNSKKSKDNTEFELEMKRINDLRKQKEKQGKIIISDIKMKKNKSKIKEIINNRSKLKENKSISKTKKSKGKNEKEKKSSLEKNNNENIRENPNKENEDIEKNKNEEVLRSVVRRQTKRKTIKEYIAESHNQSPKKLKKKDKNNLKKISLEDINDLIVSPTRKESELIEENLPTKDSKKLSLRENYKNSIHKNLIFDPSDLIDKLKYENESSESSDDELSFLNYDDVDDLNNKQIIDDRPAYVSKRNYGLSPEKIERNEKLQSLLDEISKNQDNPYFQDKKETKKILGIVFNSGKKKRRVNHVDKKDFYSSQLEDNKIKMYNETVKEMSEDIHETLELKKRLMYNLEIYKNNLVSLSRDDDAIDGYERVYQELLKSNDLDEDIFMEKVQHISRLLRKEEENIEEIRKQEKRMNQFKNEMVDELYRTKLRRDGKFEHTKVADSMPITDFDESFNSDNFSKYYVN